MSPPRSILDLQRLLCQLGYAVETDGQIGPETRRAWEAVRDDALSPPPEVAIYELLVRAGAKVTTSFRLASDPRGRHDGIDLSELHGDPCEAAAEGVVHFAGEARREDGSGDGYGLQVQLVHANGERTRYAHLSSIAVKVGQKILRGQVIGLVGTTGKSTGPHLHFEVLSANGAPLHPWGRVRVIWSA